MISLYNLIVEHAKDNQTNEKFTEFAQKRYDGAKKIVDAAKKKGGAAMLTYHHFRVKLPYYKKAAAGKFDLGVEKSEFKTHLSKLCQLTGDVNMKQIEFQKLVGIIEVIGELIIKSDELN
jgi:hypothetical protein